MINVHERDPKEYIKGIKETLAAVEAGRLNPEKLYLTPIRYKKLQKRSTTSQAAPMVL